MTLRSISFTLVLSSLAGTLLAGSAGAQSRHVIMSQKDAPIRVVEYDAQIWGTGSEVGEGIRHDFRFRNDSDRGVVAVKFGVLSYDIFNEFQEETETIVVRDMEPAAQSRHGVVVFPVEPTAFHTGLLYVRKVRFLDGEIWEVSPEDLDAMIRAFEEELGLPGS